MRTHAGTAIQRTLARAKIDAARTYVVDGSPEEALRKLAAQMLVMGAISRRGLRRFALGNTAERTIHASPCDLLILKPQGFSLRLGRTYRESVILPGSPARGRKRNTA